MTLGDPFQGIPFLSELEIQTTARTVQFFFRFDAMQGNTNEVLNYFCQKWSQV